MTQPSSRSRMSLGLRLVALSLGCGFLVAVGCSGGDELPRAGTGGSGAGGSGFEAGPCAEGTTRACGVTLAKQGNVLTCYEGTQTCEGGAWGECTDGEVKQRRWDPPSGESRTQAFGPPTPCQNNPCDPFCQNFDEQPDGGIGTDASGGYLFTWETGSIDDLPPTLVNKGLKQPCRSGADCQFDHYCRDVSTAGSCGHSKCVPGVAPPSSCDPCVTMICAQDPSCCANACAHDVCAPGLKLDASCSTCVQSVCAAQPSCCSTSWDASCAALVPTLCAGISCACDPTEIEFQGRCYRNEGADMDWDTARSVCQARGPSWDLASIASQAENDFVGQNTNGDTWVGYTDVSAEGTFVWATGEPTTYTNWEREPQGGTTQNCSRISSASGFWDDHTCTTTYPSICESAPYNIPPCPSFATQNGTSCYVLRAVNANFATAQSYCTGLGPGWNLAAVGDATENAFVQGFTTTASNWIGFNDRDAPTGPGEGTFAWTNGDPVTYTNWHNIQPAGGAVQNCAQMVSASGRWDDVACTSSIDTICEAPSFYRCGLGEINYNGKCYWIDATTRNFATAENPATAGSCANRGVGWHLADIDDAAENAFVLGLTTGGSDYWIGLNDRDVPTGLGEGNYSYTSGAPSPVTFFNWLGGEPTGAAGVTQDCVSLNDTSGLWQDRICTGTVRSVCESPELAAPPACPTGSVQNGGSCYVYSTTNRTWAVGQTFCAAQGSTFKLATIDDAAENTFVRSQLVAATWLGLNDQTTEGTWVWDSGAAVGYTNWDREPNASTAATDCTRLDKTLGDWYDDDCASTRNYVCERAQSAPAVGCEPEYVSSGGRCYRFNATAANWTNAEAACVTIGSTWHLAAINDAAENAYIQSQTGAATLWWAGLTDQAVEATWVWQSGDPVTYTNWAQLEPNNNVDEDCTLIRRNVTTFTDDRMWNDLACSTARNSFCEGPKKSYGANQWTQACVDKVKTVCDAFCSTTVPPASAGTCVPWLPGQTDSTCAGFDLALGVPCTGGVVPVCNHGTQPAPAGIELLHFPAAAAQYAPALCAPDVAQSNGSCTTTAIIAPGECTNVTCPNLADTDEIMVNPAGAAHVTECSCLDNWTLYSAAAQCGPPDCSGSVAEANFKKVNMYFIFDRSGSMAGTKWDGSVAALTSFFQDPSTAGLGVALEFFSLAANVDVGGVNSGDGCGELPCSPAVCANPMVALGTLTAQAAPADTQEGTLITALGVGPAGNTPAYPAMRGALDWAIARQASTPTETHVVILVTDGDPNGCFQGGSAANTNIAIGNDAESAYLNSGIQTYTVCMEGANCTALDNIAWKGGTGQAFVITAMNQAQVATDLKNALLAIAGQNVACDFPLPNQGSFNASAASVTYTPGGGGPTQTLTRFPDATGCGDGWYYDDNANPTSITLCTSTCGTVQADQSAKVEVQLGCPVTYLTQSHSQIYEGLCAADSGPQWGLFTYDATVPATSSMSFRARTANLQTDLGAAAWTNLAAIPSDPAVCPLAGPAPCPIDLFAKLGFPNQRHKFLELEITASPTSNKLTSPTLNDWRISYSCQPSQ